jgi:uncharacterized protein (UPF0264 family)
MKKTIRCIFEVEVQETNELDAIISDMYYMTGTNSLCLSHISGFKVAQVSLVEVEK